MTALVAAELTEQGLLRIGDVTRQRVQRTLGAPHLPGVNDQARLLYRLQREVHSRQTSGQLFDFWLPIR